MTPTRFVTSVAIVVVYVAAVVSLGEVLGDSTSAMVVAVLLPFVAFHALAHPDDPP